MFGKIRKMILVFSKLLKKYMKRLVESFDDSIITLITNINHLKYFLKKSKLNHFENYKTKY